MKKLIISIVCLLAFAAGVLSYAYYRGRQIVAKNSLAQANVEALTEDETSLLYTPVEMTVSTTTTNSDGSTTTVSYTYTCCMEHKNGFRICGYIKCS